MEEDSRMAFERKEKELELQRKQREMEKEAMQVQHCSVCSNEACELADLHDQTSIKMHGTSFQIEVAQGSCHGSTVSPRVMSLSFDDDENSYIKSWLDQNRRPGDLKVNFAECCGNCRKKHCYLKRSSTSDCTK